MLEGLAGKLLLGVMTAASLGIGLLVGQRLTGGGKFWNNGPRSLSGARRR